MLEFEDLSLSKNISKRAEPLSVQDWGQIDYLEGLRRQMDLVDLVSQELAREVLVFCSHPPVVTLGRGTQPGDVAGWQGQTVEIGRGGRATYHGPSQLVVYPIIDLSFRERGRDIHRYLRIVEDSIVETLKAFGIESSGRSQQLSPEGVLSDATGVWVGNRKIASVGIGVRKWVTFHGVALNVSYDPTAFAGLKPCGFTPGTMISMEEVLGSPVEREKVQAILLTIMNQKLARKS